MRGCRSGFVSWSGPGPTPGSSSPRCSPRSRAPFSAYRSASGLYKAEVHHRSLPPATWLAVALLGTLTGMAALTIVPARIGSREPVAEVLQSATA